MILRLRSPPGRSRGSASHGAGWGGGRPGRGRGCAGNAARIRLASKSRSAGQQKGASSPQVASSASGLRQYLEAIRANQRVKSSCASSLPLGTARPEAAKLLLQMLLHIRNPFSTNWPHQGHFGGRLLRPPCGAACGVLGVSPLPPG